jgi:uracil-DNA glycosylase
VSEIPLNTLRYRLDGPEDAPALFIGPSLGATWVRHGHPLEPVAGRML